MTCVVLSVLLHNFLEKKVNIDKFDHYNFGDKLNIQMNIEEGPFFLHDVAEVAMDIGQ